MSNPILLNLMPQDYGLTEKLLFRPIKKCSFQFMPTVSQRMTNLQKYPKCFVKTNFDSHLHNTHLQKVKKDVQNQLKSQKSYHNLIGQLKDRAIKKLFQYRIIPIQKTGDQTVQPNCPKDQKKLTNAQNKIQPQNNPVENASFQKHGYFTGLEKRVLFSGGLSAVFNIKLLTNGDYQRFFTKVGTDIGLKAAHCVLSNSLSSLGEAGGIISSLAIASVVNVAGLMQSGDWSRFILSTGGTFVSVAAAYGGAEGGAIIGTMICPGIGTMVGGPAGGLASRLISAWVYSKVMDTGKPTEYESRQAQKATSQIRDRMNQDLIKIGHRTAQNAGPQSLLQKQQIPITKKPIQQVCKGQKSYLTSQMLELYRRIVTPIASLKKMFPRLEMFRKAQGFQCR